MEKTKKVNVVEVVRHGDQLIMPEKLKLNEAIEVLQRQMEYEEEKVAISEPIRGAFVWDGALAFVKAMKQKFGWATAEPQQGFFGNHPPEMIAIETDVNETQLVTWGKFTVPGVAGYVECGHELDSNGQVIFKIVAEVRRKHEPVIRELAQLTREILQKDSIYRGKALKIRFREDNGRVKPLPRPTFIDLSQVKPEELIYAADVEAAIRDSVFTPIEHTELCRKAGIPLKRGILLAGTYGVGKSMAARVTAYLARQNGWMFLMCERADELVDAINFAKQQIYAPAVVFCEDVDKVVSGERDISMDQILNTIDSVDSKGSEIMIILTTNNLEEINQGMIRPGRLDAVIEVTPPDAGAAEKLVRLYGRGLVSENEDLSQVGKLLAGKIPAVIRECVERSKLSAISRAKTSNIQIVAQDLITAVKSMGLQLQLLSKKTDQNENDLDRFGKIVGQGIGRSIRYYLDEYRQDFGKLPEPRRLNGRDHEAEVV